MSSPSFWDLVEGEENPKNPNELFRRRKRFLSVFQPSSTSADNEAKGGSSNARSSLRSSFSVINRFSSSHSYERIENRASSIQPRSSVFLELKSKDSRDCPTSKEEPLPSQQEGESVVVIEALRRFARAMDVTDAIERTLAGLKARVLSNTEGFVQMPPVEVLLVLGPQTSGTVEIVLKSRVGKQIFLDCEERLKTSKSSLDFVMQDQLMKECLNIDALQHFAVVKIRDIDVWVAVVFSNKDDFNAFSKTHFLLKSLADARDAEKSGRTGSLSEDSQLIDLCELPHPSRKSISESCHAATEKFAQVSPQIMAEQTDCVLGNKKNQGTDKDLPVALCSFESEMGDVKEKSANSSFEMDYKHEETENEEEAKKEDCVEDKKEVEQEDCEKEAESEVDEDADNNEVEDNDETKAQEDNVENSEEKEEEEKENVNEDLGSSRWDKSRQQSKPFAKTFDEEAEGRLDGVFLTTERGLLSSASFTAVTTPRERSSTFPTLGTVVIRPAIPSSNSLGRIDSLRLPVDDVFASWVTPK